MKILLLNCRAMNKNMGVLVETCLFKELQETYQFSGLLAKCQFGMLRSII